MKKILSLIVCFSLVVASLSFPNTVAEEVDVTKEEQSIAEIDAKIQNNKAKISEFQKELEAKKSDIKSERENLEILQQKILLQNENIVAVQSQIDILDRQIQAKENDIATLEASIVQQEADIADEIEAFKKRLLAMYVSDTADITQILVGTSDFIDILARVQVVQSVSKQDKKMLDELDERLNNLNIDRQNIETEKIELQIKKENTEKKKEEFQGLLDDLNNDMADIQARIDELDAEEANINWQINVANDENEDFEAESARLEEEIKRKQEEAAKKAAMKALDPSLLYTGGALNWPVPSSYMVTSGFGPRWGTTHRGLDIGAPSGSPIVAAESGVVIVVNPSGWGGGYGKYVVVSHNESLSTLYGHMSEVGCAEGDVVTRGQVIGYVGSTGDSTGNHLHFEVRYNGARTDPTSYL
ncbi:MAG: peptidoglycan DD-metalloendopeptidase family protein [Oscillospiraceae bacterium]|nr:peptidoglycan DD-metalloendopeptidase family protein [Oscillospiraceae bacterium]